MTTSQLNLRPGNDKPAAESTGNGSQTMALGTGAAPTGQPPQNRLDAKTASSSPGRPHPHAVDPISILVVDDEPRNRTVLETVLDDPNYRLVLAESADEALLALISQEFALIILDIRMPSISGFELAKMIKDRKKTAQIPIIFLTAYYQDNEHILDGYGSGAVDYMNKPVNAAVLRSKVAVFAELHRKQREVERFNKVLLAEVESRRAAEVELRDLNNRLEQIVQQRTEHIQTLLNEVSHRSKNVLSLVSAIAAQTVGNTVEGFKRRFGERVLSLAAHHDLLVSNQWTTVDLDALIRAQLAHFADLIGTQITIDGPALSVAPGAAQTLAMAFHELATNAAKHGSLSGREGRVDVSWRVEGNPPDRFTLRWQERDGPPVTEPSSRGFGSKVLKGLIELGLNGKAEVDYAPSGFSWTFVCPPRGIHTGKVDASGLAPDASWR